MTLLLFLLDWEKAIHGWRQLESKNLVLKGTVYILERPLLTISKFSHKNVLQKCFCLLSMIILHLLSVGRPQFSIMSQRNLRSVETNLHWKIFHFITALLVSKSSTKLKIKVSKFAIIVIHMNLTQNWFY